MKEQKQIKTNKKSLIRSNGNRPLSEQERETMIEEASTKYAEFLEALGFDWRDDENTKDTPRRVAKAYIDDLFRGSYTEAPDITAFDNTNKYNGMVFQGGINVVSVCAHHILPFLGQAYVAYIPKEDGKVIGLSKLNRIVEHYARRPQVQENLTMQIHDHVDRVCENNKGVAVMISAHHTCVSCRGIKHHNTQMKTAKLSDAFRNNDDTRKEFYDFVDEYLTNN